MPICIYATSVSRSGSGRMVEYRVVVTDFPGVADAAVLECRTTDALGETVWARVDPAEGAIQEQILRAAIRQLADEALRADSHRVVSGSGRVSIDLGPV